ncbi:MAG: N-acetylmuramoyl-L-alanine amidase, partial [Pseudomonadota bacterium]
SGIQEKTVVLQIAKKLRDMINSEPNLKAFLTRERDYFIPLRQRWRIAKEYDADVFISIHANAGFNKNKSGAEVYCLSLGGASQEAARILADKENYSDRIGGVDLTSCPAEVDSILLSMTQNKAINDGLILGKITLQELEKVNSINFPTPLQAGFAVLKAPDIPSILIEVGYISNPQEAKLLTSDHFQSKLAAAFKKSVILFSQRIQPEVARNTSMFGRK